MYIDIIVLKPRILEFQILHIIIAVRSEYQYRESRDLGTRIRLLGISRLGIGHLQLTSRVLGITSRNYSMDSRGYCSRE